VAAFAGQSIGSDICGSLDDQAQDYGYQALEYW
jgi:hypothetical protein